MKSIAQMAKEQNISSSTIREYISRFEEFFPDPVEHEGVKEYPPETEDLIKRIYGYYNNSGMTKDEIRVKLGGAPPEGPQASGGGGAVMGAMDTAQFKALEEKLDHLIATIENLTAAISGASVDTFKSIRKQAGSHEKINQINEQLSSIVELSRGEDVDGEDMVEKNVLESDGTVVFSFGRLSPSGIDSINFAKAHKKPWLHIDLETEKNPSLVLKKWMPQFNIKVLNVAGKSASKIPGLKRSINDMISLVLNE